ncbi:MAG: glycoside hydrolase family 2 protein [Erysipelotrichaceae bacterium]|nr:glycoside hydrolase family 2 protein [Erysipelotrichaceae bacterium]
MMTGLNNNWQFTENWTEAFMRNEGVFPTVRLPHTVKEVPYHYVDDKSYQMICGYRTIINITESLAYKRVFVHFEGAGHIATVYLDGHELVTHKCGYTAFEAELTDYVKRGQDHVLAVRLDTTENGEVPPFGFVIDYLTYGGIYRPVWLDIREKTYIDDLFIYTPQLDEAVIKVSVDPYQHKVEKKIEILDSEDNVIKRYVGKDDEIRLKFENVRPWSPESPVIYRCRATVGKSVREEEFGFRTVEFRENEFLLNGSKYFIRGLNRHQCYPYLGYAVSDSLQVEDARILKEELGCNSVRTSHYPQSKAFIRACDHLGLLVFTEIPGWQHIGNDAWKQQAMENTREMVMQYRNHPSIYLWGVRINESQDDDEFYRQTNDIAHTLDPSRATGGVRYIENSHLLEDVYTYNDFSHNGKTPGVKKKNKVTKEKKPLLITESNGHMFPTKSFDYIEKRQEHALRHARVMNDAMADGEHVGSYQWCMFDYATHKDFGSGDRVCYHGVMDGFRNPKLAASVYASQQDEKPVLEIGSSMDIGDYPGGMLSKVYAFTNADSVKLYKNNDFVAEFSQSEFKAMKHGPLLIDDTIGELLKTNEGFTGNKEKLLHDCLKSAAVHGISSMPLKDTAKMGYAMLRYHLKYSDGVALYGKYVGNWGGEATVWRYDAVKNGEVVASKTLKPNCRLHLEAKANTAVLTEGETYDMAAVRVRILDENDTVAVYAQLPVSFECSGPVELVGPNVVTAEGGMTGTYLKTTGETGEAILTVKAGDLAPVQLRFEIRRAN